MPNSEAIEKILDEMVSAKTSFRIESRMIDGEKVWFKQYSKSAGSIYLAGHRLLSFLLRHPFLKANPVYKGKIALEKEVQRMEEFQAAGFGTPEIVTSRDNILVTKDLGTIFDDELRALRKTGGAGHDGRLCDWVCEFGLLHGSGLVHGRPHPRDAAFKNGKWVFFDFEEHPQEVMPLVTAQARDLVLIFHILTKRMLNQKNLEQALHAYQENAPVEVLQETRKIIDGLQPLVKIAKLIMKLRSGKDLQRFVRATDFLKQNLELN